MRENADLVDIRDISVDKTLPKIKRIAEYIRQIKNPSGVQADDARNPRGKN